MIIFNSWKPLTIITKRSILDVAATLDPPLTMFLLKILVHSYIHYTLHSGRKYFCCYCLQAFSTEERLKRHIKDCFKINDEQKIKIPRKMNTLFLKRNWKKNKISIRNIQIKNQNPDESYTNKDQKHVACSYGYKLVCHP